VSGYFIGHGAFPRFQPFQKTYLFGVKTIAQNFLPSSKMSSQVSPSALEQSESWWQATKSS